MPIISKICLGIAIFLGCGLTAYAAFNYDSSRNYFYIDSILKTGGNYIIVGDALSGYCSDRKYISENECLAAGKDWQEKLSKIDSLGNVSESSQFFAVSNNLIFNAFYEKGQATPTYSAKFTSGETRRIARNPLTQKFEFKTNAITLSGAKSFEIITMGTNKTLEISPEGAKIDVNMNQNFQVNGGISFSDIPNPEDYNIYVDKVLTTEVGTSNGNPFLIKDGLVKTAAPQLEAENIYFNNDPAGQPLCYVLPVTNLVWDQNSNYSVPYLTSHPTMPRPINCRENYYIFDAKVNYNAQTKIGSGEAKFVCCRLDDDQTK